MGDPNWLLSSAVQSGAALVAIIGGMLISRLVGLSADKDGLARRRRELEDARSAVRSRSASVAARRLHMGRIDLLSLGSDLLVETEGEIEVETLVADALPRLLSEAEARQAADGAIELTRDIARQLRAYEGRPPGDLDGLRNAGFDVAAAGAGKIWTGIASTVRRERPPAPSQSEFTGLKDYSVLHSFQPDSWADRDAETRDELVRDQRKAIEDLASLDAQLANINDALGAIGRPQGIGSTLAVLTYLAVVTIVVPLLLMPASTVEPFTPWRRWLVVGGFFSGLAAVLGQVLYTVRSLSDGRPGGPRMGRERSTNDDE